MAVSWVRASLPPMLGPLPSWTVIPLPLLLLNWGFFMLMVTLVTMATGAYLSSKDRTLIWTIRRFRTTLRGYRMDARPLGYRRAMNMDVPMQDFDFDKWRHS